MKEFSLKFDNEKRCICFNCVFYIDDINKCDKNRNESNTANECDDMMPPHKKFK